MAETPSAKRKARQLSYRETRQLDSEEARWRRGIERVEGLVAGQFDSPVVHVLDSEGDDYRLLAALTGGGRRFVLRAAFDRVLAAAEMQVPRSRTREFVAQSRVIAKRKVTLARRRRRPGDNRKRTQVREERTATLTVRAASVMFQRPCYGEPELPPVLSVNVVLVQEHDPPPDAEPVEWVLLTTEPITTKRHTLAVVDAYRGRWVIEEYFKALKTGCAVEKRQADSWHSILNVLALLVPLAWSLLRLRTVARHAPCASAAAVLTPLQLQVLRRASPTALSCDPSTKEAMLAVARLGGHLRSNGDPGWLVLGRGYSELLALTAGYRLANPKK